MDSNQKLINLIRWSIEHKIKILFMFVSLILLILFVSFLARNAFVFISVSASFETKNIITYAISGKPTKKIGSTGLIIVPRDSTSLVVTSGEYIKTESKIDIPWYGYTDKKIQLQQDKNVTKIAFKSTVGAECATYDPTIDRLAYYQCKNPKNLITYQNAVSGGWQSKELAKFFYTNKRAAPYLGGILGITFNETSDAQIPGKITIVSSTGKIDSLNIPDTIDTSELNQSLLITNTYDPTDNRFVIATLSGDIFIGTPTTEGFVEYHHIAAPQDYNRDYNQTLCTLSRNTVNCYQGPGTFGDARESFDFSKVTASQILSYSFDDSSEKIHKLPTNLYKLSDIQVDTNGELFGTYYNELYHFVRKGDSYTIETISQNTTAISGGDNLYYIQNKGVYVVDNTKQSTAHQIFYSPNITPKAIYAVSGKVFIIGSVTGNSSTTYAYLLNSDINTNPGKRLVDLLPSTSSILKGDVSSIDFVGNKLYAKLIIPYSKESNLNRGIDPGLLAETKNKVLDSLLTLGLTTTPEDITFTY